MIPFPSINQFRNVVQHVRRQSAFMGLDAAGEPILNPAPKYPKLTFTGTVKLHGTNAAIVFTDTGVMFQSRSRVLTPEADNAGFLAHMSQQTQALQSLHHEILRRHPLAQSIAIYGEWCGGNIQKGVAITGLPKMFIIFALRIDEQWEDFNYLWDASASIGNISRFPTWTLEIDFEHPEIAQNRLAELTQKVEACCPVGKALGVEGVGEGIVWRCTSDPSSEFWFKVKGEEHSASKVKVLASVDVEAIAQVNEFIAMAVTEARLSQGLHYLVNEQQKPFAMTSMGDFIRWVHTDVMKEEADTIAANGFDHKKLGSPIALAAKRWFIEKLNVL